MAKNNKNIIHIKYKDNSSSVDKKFILVDFIEKDNQDTFEKKVDLYLKDIEKNEENITKIDIANVQNFIVADDNISFIGKKK